ncbi:MAG: single-stranded DNA-binding protein [Planctomycetes bacterium]|nr:single-stranded DNA-binding protein [Planctomycetota bacterium]
MDSNKVVLMGNLTRDPQLKYLPSNTAMCEFMLAVNRRWRDRDGNQRDETCFVDLVAFGRTGELIHERVGIGQPILVECRLRLDRWRDRNGTPRLKTSIIAENFAFCGPRELAQQPEQGHRQPAEATQREPAGQPDRVPTTETPRGGRHHVYRQPRGSHFGNTANKIADGVDIRADRGYIVVAPSVVNGVRFRWTNPLYPVDALPELPTWLNVGLRDEDE